MLGRGEGVKVKGEAVVTRAGQFRSALGGLGGLVLAGPVTQTYDGSSNVISGMTALQVLIVSYFGFRLMQERRSKNGG